MLNLEKNFKFNNNDRIVVGCSTGPDSMALVDLLLRIRSKYNLFLVIAHVNHNLRVESNTEEKFLREYCLKNSLIFEGMKIENYGDDNFHNEARNIRYSFFDSLVHKYGADYLMTAHHGDDLMETVLMRIVRGSNLNGYGGFKFIVDMGSYKIVRPLIFYTKKEIEEYNIANKVTFFLDKSNDKDIYTRNRYRKYVLPFLKQEDNDVNAKFLKYSQSLYMASAFIEKERDLANKRVILKGKINIELFLKEDLYIQREILYYYLNQFYLDDLLLVNDRHVDLIFGLINSKKANATVNLPNDVLAKKEYSMLSIVRDIDAIVGYEIEFDKIASLPNNHVIERIDDVDDNSNNICRLNTSDLVLPLIIRTRKIGDKMAIKGLGVNKKVNDIFINKKVSKAHRDSWPVVIDSSGKVVWIPGLQKSIFDKKKTESYDIILKYS